MFTPNQSHIDFAREIIRISADGAIWQHRRTGLTYQLDKKNKVMTLLTPPVKYLNRNQRANHERTKIIFKACNWLVTEKPDQDAAVN